MVDGTVHGGESGQSAGAGVEESTIGGTFNGSFGGTCSDATGVSIDGMTNEWSGAVESGGTWGNTFAATFCETSDEPVSGAYPGMMVGASRRAVFVNIAGP